MKIDGVEVERGGRVTLVDRRGANAHVVILDGAGPKYLSGRSVHVDPDDGRERTDSSWKYERARYLVVAGERRDVVELARRANAAFQDARRRHSSAQERAEWKMRDAFRERWLARNPHPEAPAAEQLIDGTARTEWPEYGEE